MNIGKNQFDEAVKETNANTKKITDQLEKEHGDLFDSIRAMRSDVCAGAPVDREQLNTINNTLDVKSRSEKNWKVFLKIIGDILHRRYLDPAQGTDRYQITEEDLMENCDAPVDVPVDVVVSPPPSFSLSPAPRLAPAPSRYRADMINYWSLMDTNLSCPVDYPNKETSFYFDNLLTSGVTDVCTRNRQDWWIMNQHQLTFSPLMFNELGRIYPDGRIEGGRRRKARKARKTKKSKKSRKARKSRK